MYVLVHKNRVLAGPMGWNRGIFEGNLKKLGIQQGIGREPPTTLPMQFTPDTIIYEARVIQPDYNKKIEYPHGPFWEFTNIATGTFQLLPLPLDQAKYYVKTLVSENRYNYEIKGINITIQAQQVFITTDRSQRAVFYESYLMMNDNETINWKFQNNWVTLTKPELSTIVQAIASHVQGAFDWEKNKHQEIDNCPSLQVLKDIVIDP